MGMRRRLTSGPCSGSGRRAAGPAAARQVGRAPGRLRPRHRPAAGEQLGTFATKRSATSYARRLARGRAGTDTRRCRRVPRGGVAAVEGGRVEAATLDQYGWAVRRHIVPLLGAVRLRDLTAEVVDGWVAELVAPARTASPASARRRRGWCARCCRWRWRRRSSGAGSPATRSCSPSRRDRERAQGSWAGRSTRPAGSSPACRPPAVRRVPPVLVTGLRRGELLGLRWSDVDLDGRQLVPSSSPSSGAGRCSSS